MAGGRRSRSATTWIERSGRSERACLVLAAASGLDGVLTATTALGLHCLTAAATESELAESLLDKARDKGRHFWFI